MAHHLILDLHEILRVEEAAGLEPWGPYPLGVAVEALQSLQTLGLGIAPGHGARCAEIM
jgi:hypothetical protein